MNWILVSSQTRNHISRETKTHESEAASSNPTLPPILSLHLSTLHLSPGLGDDREARRTHALASIPAQNISVLDGKKRIGKPCLSVPALIEVERRLETFDIRLVNEEDVGGDTREIFESETAGAKMANIILEPWAEDEPGGGIHSKRQDTYLRYHILSATHAHANRRADPVLSRGDDNPLLTRGDDNPLHSRGDDNPLLKRR